MTSPLTLRRPGSSGVGLVALVATLATASAPLAAQNKVEPFSNGLRLHWTKEQVIQRFGEPTDRTWDAGIFGYADFRVTVYPPGNAIHRVVLKTPAIRLASGIGVGSAVDDVRRVFGQTSDVVSGQYRLSIEYDGGRVYRLTISPVGDAFAPAATVAGGPATPGSRAAGNPMSAPTAMAGRWYGVNVANQLTLTADGRYTTGAGGSGSWRQRGDTVQFSGPLTAWNGGTAVLSRGALEFHWTNREGAVQYFAFVRKD
ncbi:MAG: hypothetical protein KJT01_06290 [Gemmatimonadetes bacterium]|nr:hypothetical protein [Gemmatimonadota bacterium]